MKVDSNSRKPYTKVTRLKRKFRAGSSLLPIAVLSAIFVAVFMPLYNLYDTVTEHAQISPQVEVANEVDWLPFYRDLYKQDPWSDVEWNFADPSQVQPLTAHYLWCGRKSFKFQHYLGVLSLLRVARPLRLVFHYTHLPVLDRYWYHTWFLELRQSLPYLELHQMDEDLPCGSPDLIRVALRLLSSHGGLFLGEGVVLSGNVEGLRHLPFWFASSPPPVLGDPAGEMDIIQGPSSGVIFVSRAFNDNTLENYFQIIQANAPTCLTKDHYNLLEPEMQRHNRSLCVFVTDDVYPRDVRTSDSPFARLARWLYYGSKEPFLTYHSTEEDLIPRVSHYTWPSTADSQDKEVEFTFQHFLSVLSALYIADVDHVYFYGNTEPKGLWWEELVTSENVTFIVIDGPNFNYAFHHSIHTPSRAYCVLGYNILYKYGGIYQDRDVIWTSPLPDWLLGYTAVAGPERSQYGMWPGALTPGVLLAKPRAPFLRHVLSSLRHFRDGGGPASAVLMPYRAYERHPDSLYLDYYLQAKCEDNVCHTAWENVKSSDSSPSSSTSPPSTSSFSLEEVRSVHLRSPLSAAAVSSPRAVAAHSRDGDPLADLARQILEVSGRAGLLDTEGDAEEWSDR